MQGIYAFHVLNSTASFAEIPLSVQEIQHHYIAITSQALPWLVAIMNGQVVGYCYAGPYRTRIAYRFTLENSSYLWPDHTGRGIGKVLLSEAWTTTTTLHQMRTDK